MLLFPRLPRAAACGMLAIGAAVVWTAPAGAAAKPSLKLNVVPASLSNDPNPAVGWSQNFVPQKVACTLDGKALAHCVSRAPLPTLKSGLHTFAVTAITPSGQKLKISDAWLTDVVVPTAPVVEGPATWQSGPVTLTAGGSADSGGSGLAGYQHRTFANGAWSAAVSGSSVTVSAEGTTQFEFRSIDRAGNASAWVDAAARIDTGAPTLAPSGGSSTWTAAAVTIAAHATDTGSGVASVIYQTSTDNGDNWSDPQPGDSVTVTADGTTLVRFQASDNSGQTSGWTTPDGDSTARIDTTPPQLAPSGGSSSFKAGPITISANATDDGSGVASVIYQTSSDGGANWSDPQPGDSVTFTSGSSEVRFQATDNLGNTSEWTTPDGASTADLEEPLDIALVVDRTGSMGDSDKMTNLRNALLQGFLPSLDPTLDGVGMTVFPPDMSGVTDICRSASSNAYQTSTPTYSVVPLSTDYQSSPGVLNSASALVKDITCLQPGGDTAYATALQAANTQLQTTGRPGVQKVIILLTDGAANTGQNCNDVTTTTGTGTAKKTVTTKDQDPQCLTPCHAAINDAQTDKSSGTLVYTILYGSQSDQPYCEDYDGLNEVPQITPTATLQQMASPGGFYVDTVPTLLPTVFQNILASLATQQ